MSFSITLPTGMDLKSWADRIVYDLDPFGSFGKLQNELDWQDWAASLMNNTTLTETIPSPYQFTDWREWAERFCSVMA